MSKSGQTPTDNVHNFVGVERKKVAVGKLSVLVTSSAANIDVRQNILTRPILRPLRNDAICAEFDTSPTSTSTNFKSCSLVDGRGLTAPRRPAATRWKEPRFNARVSDVPFLFQGARNNHARRGNGKNIRIVRRCDSSSTTT